MRGGLYIKFSGVFNVPSGTARETSEKERVKIGGRNPSPAVYCKPEAKAIHAFRSVHQGHIFHRPDHFLIRISHMPVAKPRCYWSPDWILIPDDSKPINTYKWSINSVADVYF